jgi:hypothetical protein
LPRGEPFQFNDYFVIYPKVVAALQPWAAISQRLRRNFKLMHYRLIGLFAENTFLCYRLLLCGSQDNRAGV